jgi:hypothetical protein
VDALASNKCKANLRMILSWDLVAIVKDQ